MGKKNKTKGKKKPTQNKSSADANAEKGGQHGQHATLKSASDALHAVQALSEAAHQTAHTVSDAAHDAAHTFSDAAHDAAHIASEGIHRLTVGFGNKSNKSNESNADRKEVVDVVDVNSPLEGEANGRDAPTGTISAIGANGAIGTIAGGDASKKEQQPINGDSKTEESPPSSPARTNRTNRDIGSDVVSEVSEYEWLGDISDIHSPERNGVDQRKKVLSKANVDNGGLNVFQVEVPLEVADGDAENAGNGGNVRKRGDGGGQPSEPSQPTDNFILSTEEELGQISPEPVVDVTEPVINQDSTIEYHADDHVEHDTPSLPIQSTKSIPDEIVDKPVEGDANANHASTDTNDKKISDTDENDEETIVPSEPVGTHEYVEETHTGTLTGENNNETQTFESTSEETSDENNKNDIASTKVEERDNIKPTEEKETKSTSNEENEEPNDTFANGETQGASKRQNNAEDDAYKVMRVEENDGQSSNSEEPTEVGDANTESEGQSLLIDPTNAESMDNRPHGGKRVSFSNNLVEEQNPPTAPSNQRRGLNEKSHNASSKSALKQSNVPHKLPDLEESNEGSSTSSTRTAGSFFGELGLTFQKLVGRCACSKKATKSHT